jgi:hypothetical protein
MSLPDATPARKPRRLGLYLPFALLLVAIVAWSGFWVWARSQAAARMDAAVQDLARAGYQVTWGKRTIGGYPFRLDVTLTDARIREPSGWGLDAPRLEGETYLYAAGHWMLAAPSGLTFVRPIGGPVAVTGKLLRASLGGLDERPPSFSFQGEGLAFAPGDGAQPFFLTAAELVELHLRRGPDDEGGVFLRVDKGKARLTGLFGRIAGDKPISIEWNSTLSKASALVGGDWPSLVRNWADGGGVMTVRPGSKIAAGDALIEAQKGQLSVGRDGRLRGALAVALKEAPRALGALAATGAAPETAVDAASAVVAARQEGEIVRAAINFEAGTTTLGPVALGPAPRVYTPR